MKNHPYVSLPDRAYWRRGVSNVAPGALDPIEGIKLRITREDKVATAGSCFAQHIARYLSTSGFTYYVSEQAHPLLSEDLAKTHNYGMFTARYGNLYTTRQFLQLIRRAYGEFTPIEDIWREADGTFLDPFRPNIQPGGFQSEGELRGDRDQHLAAVRDACENADVFIFTLGLTEAWVSRDDGAVFPLCPGVSGGAFDPERYAFHNFSVEEVAADLLEAIGALRKVNPKVRVLLTVSPVPLVATATEAHVVTATTYSKAVLRVAAQKAIESHADVFYFPSYEIITAPSTRGAYFAEDARSVTEEGVAHVMGLFLRHVAEGADTPAPTAKAKPREDAFSKKMGELAQVLCDEEMLDAT